MKREYDFSKGQRGKFYRPGVTLNLPVYLDAEVLAFVQRIAKKRGTDLSSVMNRLLRTDMQLVVGRRDVASCVKVMEAMNQAAKGKKRVAV